MDNEYDTASEPVETFNIPNLQPLDDLLREGAEDASQRQENLTRGTHENYTWWLRSAHRSHDMVIGHGLKGVELRKAAKTVGLTFDLVHKIHRIHENIHIVEKNVREDQAKRGNKYKYPSKTLMLRWVAEKPDSPKPPTRQELLTVINKLKAEVATLRVTPEPVRDDPAKGTPAADTLPKTAPEPEPDLPKLPGTSVTPSGEAMTLAEAVARVEFRIILEAGKPQQRATKPKPKSRVKAAGTPKIEPSKPEIPWSQSPLKSKFEDIILYASNPNHTAREMVTHLANVWAGAVDWSDAEKKKFWEMIYNIATTQNFSRWLIDQDHLAVLSGTESAVVWDGEMFRETAIESGRSEWKLPTGEIMQRYIGFTAAKLAMEQYHLDRSKVLQAEIEAARTAKGKSTARKAWKANKATAEAEDRRFNKWHGELVSGPISNADLKALELDRMPSRTGLSRQYHKLVLKLRNEHGSDTAPGFAADLLKLTAARDALRRRVK